MMASTTRIQTISGGEGDSAAWSPDLRFDIKKPSAGFPRRADNHARPVSLPKWPHPLAGTTLPRFGRLARASAPLLMQMQNTIFVDGSRGPLPAGGGRPVRVINAVLPICAQKFRSWGLFRAGRRDGRRGTFSSSRA